MKILYLTKYSRQGASSRMRSYQYFPYLSENGMAITVKPLFGDAYLNALYRGEKTLNVAVKSYFNRLFVLFSVFKYDRVVIEKEIFPYLPSWAERVLHLLGLRYIVDLDDAIFHNYDQHPNKFFRKLMNHKIDTVMQFSDAVVAGNEYLADRARKAGAKNVFVIPTIIDLNRYKIKQHSEHIPLIIGWIGTKSTFEKHFMFVKDLIKKAIDQYHVKFHIVGITEDLGMGNDVIYLSWSEDSEVDSLLKFDIGIMPLQDSLWEKGKCAYKLIQYMACGLPVIASPVGMNIEVVKENVNGLFATNESQWLAAIGKYTNDIELRKNHGIKGREMVENKFCLEVTNRKIYNIIANTNHIY